MELIDCEESLIDQVLTAATNVHRELGAGLLESVYEKALVVELSHQGLSARCQVAVPVAYKNRDLGIGFRADIVVENKLLLEIKAVDKLNDIHLAQVINYLKLMKIKRGFLLNFNMKLLKQGIKRVSI